jgi:hypothetical protein
MPVLTADFWFMKNIKSFLLFIVLAANLASYTVMGQEVTSWHRNYLGITVSELPFIDFRLSYEYRLSETHSFKAEVGYKPATRYFTDATNIDLGLDATGWCYRNTADWYYVSLGYKYYFARKKMFYISPEVFYKYMTTNGLIMYSWGLSSNSDMLSNAFEVRSMNVSVYGLNFLIGKKIPIRFSKGFNLGLDIFTGVTGRLKVMQTKSYGHIEITRYHDDSMGVIAIPISDDPSIENRTYFQGMLQFGIILYGSWKHKTSIFTPQHKQNGIREI